MYAERYTSTYTYVNVQGGLIVGYRSVFLTILYGKYEYRFQMEMETEDGRMVLAGARLGVRNEIIKWEMANG